MDNSAIAEIFRKVAEYRKDEYYQSQALLTAADAIDDLDFQITKRTLKKLRNKRGKPAITGIGERSILRITEIIETGKLQELIDLKGEESSSSSTSEEEDIFDFESILGFGPKSAAKLIKLGYTTFEQLKEDVENDKLDVNDTQYFGIKYYDDLKQRIPRDEVERISEIVKNEAKKIDKNVIFNIVGSYRRGAATSGDIDILITNTQNINILNELVDALIDIKLIKHNFTPEGEKRFMGAYRSGYPRRRGMIRKIDISFIPYESYYTALQHYTGSDAFNVKLRKKAISLGYKMSQNGIVNRDTGEKVEINSEEDIFKFLGMDYVPPEQR